MLLFIGYEVYVELMYMSVQIQYHKLLYIGCGIYAYVIVCRMCAICRINIYIYLIQVLYHILMYSEYIQNAYIIICRMCALC